MSAERVLTDWHGRPLKWDDPVGRLHGILALLGDLADDPGAGILHWATREHLAITLRLLHEERDQMWAEAAPKADDGAAIVRQLAKVDPWVRVEQQLYVCGCCGVASPTDLDVPHALDCVWQRARTWALIERIDPEAR